MAHSVLLHKCVDSLLSPPRNLQWTFKRGILSLGAGEVDVA